MNVSFDPIAAVVAHVESRGVTVSGRRSTASWAACQSVLGAWSTAGEIAAAVRSASGPAQDVLVGALLSVAAGDELAGLTVVAGLAGRLSNVVAGWARGGAGRWEVPVLAGELVSGCWAAVSVAAADAAAGRGVPARVALHIVDEAREAVRVPRRTQRRRDALAVPLFDAPPDRLPPAGAGVPVAVALAGEIRDAVRSGMITRTAAAPVFLTRVVGLDVAETAARLGCSPAAVRAVRSRAERRLTAPTSTGPVAGGVVSTVAA